MALTIQKFRYVIKEIRLADEEQLNTIQTELDMLLVPEYSWFHCRKCYRKVHKSNEWKDRVCKRCKPIK